MWVFRLGNEIRQRWEEEDEKLMEKSRPTTKKGCVKRYGGWIEILPPVEKQTRKRMGTEQLTGPHKKARRATDPIKMHNMGPDGWNVDMSGERMGVLFPWADVRFLYLPVFSFFDLVCSQSYSCVTCSKLRQHCVLAVRSRCREPRTVEQCRKWVWCSEDRSDLRGCGNDKREQDGMRKRTGGKRNMRQ